MSLFHQKHIITEMACDSAHQVRMELFERGLKSNRTFRVHVEQYLDRCENGSCWCCCPAWDKKEALRPRAAAQHVLGTPYRVEEGLRLPLHGDPLLPAM